MNIAEQLYNFKPILIKEKIKYKRIEKDDLITIKVNSKFLRDEILIDKGTISVLELCDGHLTVREIINRISKCYVERSHGQVLNYVINTIAKFCKWQIIDWENDNPFLLKYEFILNVHSKISLCNYKNISMINNLFIKAFQSKNPDKEKFFYINPLIDKTKFEIGSLSEGFYRNSAFIFTIEVNNNCEGLLYFENDWNLSVCTVNSILLFKDIKLEKRMIDFALSTVEKLTNKHLTKCRIYSKFDQDSSIDKLFPLKLLESFVLEDELGFGNHLVENNYRI